MFDAAFILNTEEGFAKHSKPPVATAFLIKVLREGITYF
jgi:hypothetical protein